MSTISSLYGKLSLDDLKIIKDMTVIYKIQYFEADFL